MNKAGRIVGLIGAALGAAALLGACATSRPPSKTVVRTSARLGDDFPMATDDPVAGSEQPPESGTAVVHVCVGDDGKLTAQPTVVGSSGSPRLDDTALQLARAGSGHYKPATENGKPVSSCFVFRITFALQGSEPAPESPAAAPDTQDVPAPHP
jgi:TonB family protein